LLWKSMWKATFGSMQGWSLFFFIGVCHIIPMLVEQRRNLPNYSSELDYRFRTSFEQMVPDLFNWIINVSIVFILIVCSHYVFGDVNNFKIIHGSVSSYGGTTLFVSVIKKFVGAPRPFFFDECKWNGTECEKEASDNAYQSFPSGHAADSFAILGFVSFYLLGVMHRMKRVNPWCFHFKPFPSSHNSIMIDMEAWLWLFALSPIGLAGIVSGSRVADHSHHSADVVAGGCVGLSMANLFHSKYFTVMDGDVDNMSPMLLKKSTPFSSSSSSSSSSDFNSSRELLNATRIASDGGSGVHQSVDINNVALRVPTTQQAYRGGGYSGLTDSSIISGGSIDMYDKNAVSDTLFEPLSKNHM
jgi:membrane-associated phospholipid phosphatase